MTGHPDQQDEEEDEELKQQTQPQHREFIQHPGEEPPRDTQKSPKASPNNRLALPISHSPKKSSPLKRRIDIEEIETEEEEEPARPTKRQMINPQQSLSSHSAKKPMRPSLLKISQERRARASFAPPPRDYHRRSVSAPNSSGVLPEGLV